MFSLLCTVYITQIIHSATSSVDQIQKKTMQYSLMYVCIPNFRLNYRLSLITVVFQPNITITHTFIKRINKCFLRCLVYRHASISRTQTEPIAQLLWPGLEEIIILHRKSKTHPVFVVTSSNVYRLSQFFHRYRQQWICNKEMMTVLVTDELEGVMIYG